MLLIYLKLLFKNMEIPIKWLRYASYSIENINGHLHYLYEEHHLIFNNNKFNCAFKFIRSECSFQFYEYLSIVTARTSYIYVENEAKIFYLRWCALLRWARTFHAFNMFVLCDMLTQNMLLL